MRRLFGETGVLASSTLSPAQAANALERAIEQAQPCRSLKTKVDTFGLSVAVGVDKFDAVKIEEIQITVDGDSADASARGTLACNTSVQAVLKGGFLATAEVHLQADLATCKVGQSSAEIIKTDGRFGDLVNGFKNEITKALRESRVKNLMKLCEN
ncbi:hypothetical protein GFL38_10625 [Rhizobium leguminosarum bv. viciae]|uniref:hypothetical protein n=1 Tax=Rhizobium ruizarguesonis TaxID=2081791 RepID=UPI00143F5DA7|nr:hypothetical protein [Rhizobium ruizarguesonis]NKJ72717.1 hypothetical protein [Rhizobium leguminosarum bv. viciae]NKQ80396.1 hypothetical protein [Rhizobium ruizarguesonis]